MKIIICITVVSLLVTLSTGLEDTSVTPSLLDKAECVKKFGDVSEVTKDPAKPCKITCHYMEGKLPIVEEINCPDGEVIGTRNNPMGFCDHGRLEQENPLDVPRSSP